MHTPSTHTSPFYIHRNVITALEKKKKFNVTGEITPDSWKETVSEFFSFACQLPDKFSPVVQSCYSQLMHCGRQLLGLQEEAVGRADNFLATTYVTHLEDFFTNK
ncbi:hypothetical protein GWK47_025417 [Chionoecetes opilio]|uniref:Uncharacterized protein n=1 Tax=Chionoecetes opilio TaxID=41210 RepID=A0A8J8WFR5_CHIOP|nr:hypothetical protein GWK47_025417 [Chionoecetes opilio]